MASVERHVDTRKNSLKVQWEMPTTEQAGDSNILSYKLIWDAGTGTVNQELTSVSNYYTDLTFTVTEGLTIGQNYLFQVQALNVYGWSILSDVGTVQSSDVPQAPDRATTVADGTDVVISFN